MVAHNVGQLKKLIENLPDNMPLVASAFDHQYRTVSACTTEAEPLPRSNYLNEYYDEECMADSSNPVIEVLLFQ